MPVARNKLLVGVEIQLYDQSGSKRCVLQVEDDQSRFILAAHVARAETSESAVTVDAAAIGSQRRAGPVPHRQRDCVQPVTPGQDVQARGLPPTLGRRRKCSTFNRRPHRSR